MNDKSPIAAAAIVAAFTCGIVIGFIFGWGSNIKTVKEVHMAADTRYFISQYLDDYADTIARNVAARYADEAKK